MKTGLRNACMWAALGIVLFAAASVADVPLMLSHQGVVTVGGERFEGTGQFRFALVDVDTGNNVWTNDGSGLGAPDTPAAPVSIPVANGAYSAILGDGDVANMTTIAADVFNTPTLMLRVWFDDGVNGVQQLAPDQSVVSAPYAIKALRADTASMAVAAQPASIDSSMIADGAVEAVDLQDGAALAEIADNDGSGSGLDADQLDGQEASRFWNLGGNTGTTPGSDYIGTADSQNLVFKVNGAGALRLEPGDAPNVVGGHDSNNALAGVIGGTVAGGGESGYPNRVTDNDGTVGGGRNNVAGDGAGTIEDAAYATVSGGAGNSAAALYAAVGGGQQNNAATVYATIGGGYQNAITLGSDNTIGGGSGNTIAAPTGHATIAGGYQNDVQGHSATIGGGEDNVSSGAASTVAGGSTNEATGDYAIVASGFTNTATGDYSAVGGGWLNDADALYSTIGGGLGNTISSLGSGGTIGGGNANEVSKSNATVGGGSGNTATESGATVSGGVSNAATGDNAAIMGGINNQAPGICASVLGGGTNVASGYYALAGGENCTASEECSVALGSMANAQHVGAFVWSDEGSGVAGAESTAANSFTARATGGVYFITAVDGSGNPTAGVYLSAGSSAWATLPGPSDRNLKEEFANVDADEILEAVAQLPIQEWQYKDSIVDIRHIGPMAQDFHKTFGVGESDRMINPTDTGGVALAAIQALRDRDQAKQARIQEQAATIEKLEGRIARLEAAVAQLTGE